MSTEALLTVKDLVVSHELDRKAMSGIYGGQVKKTSNNSSSASGYLVFNFSEAWISGFSQPD